jgi:hypothetical protein
MKPFFKGKKIIKIIKGINIAFVKGVPKQWVVFIPQKKYGSYFHANEKVGCRFGHQGWGYRK